MFIILCHADNNVAFCSRKCAQQSDVKYCKVMNVRLRRECVCERVCVGDIQAAVGRSRAALFTRNHPNLSDFYKRIMKERKNL